MACISLLLALDTKNAYSAKMIITPSHYHILELKTDPYFLLKQKDAVSSNQLGVYFDPELNAFFYRPPRTRSSVCSAVPPPSWTSSVWPTRKRCPLLTILSLLSSLWSSRQTLPVCCPPFSTYRVSMVTGSGERSSTGGYSSVQRSSSSKTWTTTNDHGL